MKDAISEVRYQALRSRLNDLHYYQPLSVDSSLLAETMLNDLQASEDSFQALVQKDDLQAATFESLKSQLEGFRLENPRLQAENNTLHLQLIEAGEAAEKRESSSRLRLRSLEDEAESVKLALQNATVLSSRWELELNGLRAEAMRLLGCDVQEEILPPVTTRPRPPRPVPQQQQEDLQAREDILTSALQQCQAQISEMEAKVTAATARTTSLEDEAAAAGQRLVSQGPSISAMQEKAEQAQIESKTAALRKDVAEQATERTALDERKATLEGQLSSAKAKALRLIADVQGLKIEEAKAANTASQLLKSSQDRVKAQKLRRQQVEERNEELRARCEAAASSSKAVAAKISKALHEEAIESKSQKLQAEEVSAELEQMSEENSRERVLLAARTEKLQSKADEAEAECKALASSRQALGEEVLAATAASEECLRQLAASVNDMQTDIHTGAQLQQRSQSSGAQLQLLNSSLLGLTGERQMLFSHLKERQEALHTASLRRVELQVESQRLAAVVRSLDSTRGEWVADLNKAVASLRQSHTSLATARKLEDAAAENCNRTRRDAQAAAASAEVAAGQKDELADEVRAFAEELQKERAKVAEAQAQASVQREELVNLEAEIEATTQAEDLQRTSSAGIAKLQEELRAAWAQRRRSDSIRTEVTSAAKQRFAASEDSLRGLQAELDTLLRHREDIAAETAAAEESQRRQRDRAGQISQRVLAVVDRREELSAEEAAVVKRITIVQQAEQDVNKEVSKLQDELRQAEAREAELFQSKALWSRTLQQQSSERERFLAAEKAGEEELAATKAVVASMAVQCSELQRDVEELVAATASADTARGELGTEIAERERQLLAEERSREQASAAGSGWFEEEKAAAAEAAVLRKAASSLDADRDEKQRVADEQAQEAVDLQNAVVANRRSLQELQQAIDDLRAGGGDQTEHLEQRRDFLAQRRELLSELDASCSKLREEAHEQGKEATSILEDLMHMTKENQELHEQVRVLEQKVKTKTSDARQQLSEQELTLQRMTALELERDDIVRLYQQVSLQSRRQQTIIERLQADQDLVKRAAGDLASEMQKAADCEEQWRSRSEQLRLDMRVIEEQLADINDRVGKSELSQREALEEDMRLEGDVAAAAATHRGADQREAAHAHAAASLRLRRQQLQAALQQTKVEAAAQHRLADDGLEQAHRLQLLLEDGHARQQRLAAEAEALRTCLAGREKSPADVQDLQQQVEKRYAEVGEMDAEHQRLQSEVLRLRSELSLRSG